LCEGVSKLEQSKTKLYVGNLPYTVTSESLKAAFAEYGEIVDAVVIMDKRFGRSKGFGFVEYAKEADAKKAVEGMNGKDMEGRTLVVNFARPPRVTDESGAEGGEVRPAAKVEKEEVVEAEDTETEDVKPAE